MCDNSITKIAKSLKGKLEKQEIAKLLDDLENKFKANLVWSSKQTANRILNLVNNFDFINSISTQQDENKINLIGLNYKDKKKMLKTF